MALCTPIASELGPYLFGHGLGLWFGAIEWGITWEKENEIMEWKLLYYNRGYIGVV